MTPIIVTACILAPLILILCLPVYVYVYYEDDFRLFLRVFGVKFALKPGGKKKPAKENKDKKEKKSSKKPQKRKTDGKKLIKQIGQIKDLVLSAKRRILTKLSFRRFTVRVTVGGDDPCDVAMLYGGVSAALNTAAAAVNSLIRIDLRDIAVNADYNGGDTEIFADIVLRTFPYKLVAGLLMFAIDYIKRSVKEK